MKNLKKIFLLALLVISFTSCSKKEDPKPQPVKTWIMGKWVRQAKTASSFSSNLELNFDSEPNGTYVSESGSSWKFTYSLKTMIYTGDTGNQWQINKISDTQISIGTPNVTVLTYYNKQ
jgi:hypothetical protein